MSKFVEKNETMDNVLLKSRLHDYIEHADNDLLFAIYVLLGKSAAPNFQYDEPTLKMLYERVENEEKPANKSYSKEETLSYVRSQKDNQL